MTEVGMRFRTTYEGWLFWVAYGGRSSFDVRKRGSNISKMDGKVTSCRYVCSNEGVRTKKQTEDVRKCFRAETRTECKDQMVTILDRGAGNYEVIDAVLEHNHPLHIPKTFHLMRSQRKILELQTFEIEIADDSGIRPKAAHELATRQVGGPLILNYTCCDRKNYLQSKRQRELAFGQTSSMLKYFGDALKLDTTFGTNKEYRSFGVFLGLNQFRETTVFGVALLFLHGDLINQNAICSCRMFKRTGILCAHGLKVLVLINIKRLSPHYILKRWTREARTRNIQDRQGRKVVANPKLEAQLRYKYMSHKFHNLAHKVAISPECCVLLENALVCHCLPQH
jgi:zinc finger SWIM domain-containing protein 3